MDLCGWMPPGTLRLGVPNHMLSFPPPSSSLSPSSSSPSTMSLSSSSLFTPTERHTFNAFLSTVSLDGSPHAHAHHNHLLSLDPTHTHSNNNSNNNNTHGGDPEAEWQMYSHLGLGVPALHAEGSDALTKATKDLIALHPPPKISLPFTGEQAQAQAQQHRPIAPAPAGLSTSIPYLLPAALRASSSAYQPARPPPSKRPRTSSPSSASRARSPSPSLLPTKSTLLSAQQKKANHIQSEQKRRANIRKGYEALCETVPSLREAIRADEEGSGSGSGGNGAGRRKRIRADEVEKVDGRAGPRSESVVLQKTIEHIQELLDEKSALLSRLNRARSMLGMGHPALFSRGQEQVPWEREWDGGKGLMMDVDGEQDSDYD